MITTGIAMMNHSIHKKNNTAPAFQKPELFPKITKINITIRESTALATSKTIFCHNQLFQKFRIFVKKFFIVLFDHIKTHLYYIQVCMNCNLYSDFSSISASSLAILIFGRFSGMISMIDTHSGRSIASGTFTAR